MANLTNLGHLNLAGNGLSDISTLSNLINLEWLFLADNTITDISALSDLINLTGLDISNATITDISALANLINLTNLGLNDNCVSDLSALSNLTNLTYLNLSGNRITDLSPLVTNTGFGSGDEVDVRKNPLSAESLNRHILTIQSTGVKIQFDDQFALGCVPHTSKESFRRYRKFSHSTGQFSVC